MKAAALFLLCSLPAVGVEKDRLMVLRHTEGETTTEYHYTSGGGITRIDRHGEPTTPPSPWNLIDHANGDITMIRPHNQSISTIPASAFARRSGPYASNAPVSLPDLSALPPEVAAAVKAAHQRAANPASVASAPPQVPTSGRIGPDPSLLPEGVKVPEMPAPPSPTPVPTVSGPPSVPPVAGPPPAGFPAGIPSPPPPGALPGGISGGLPPMPPPGAMPMPLGAGPIDHELVAHEETRTLHGFRCVRHTLRLDSSLELELWLAASSDLPPFHLLTRHEPPRFGPRDPFREWPHRVREAGKFPLLVILREAPQESLPNVPLMPIPPASTRGQETEAAAKQEIPPPRELARWEFVQINATETPGDFFQAPASYRRGNRLKP